MKITESGTIEPCCDWNRMWINYFVVGVTYTDIFLIDVSGNYPLGNSPIKFCPSCGAKTEVSKGEVQ